MISAARFKHELAWAWHPLLGLAVLISPDRVAGQLAQLGRAYGAEKVLGVLATIPADAPASQHIYAYLLFNWLALPILAFTIYFWLGAPRMQLDRFTAFRNAALGVALATASIWFIALQSPPDSEALPFGRGYLLVKLQEGSALGLYVVHCAAAWFCAICIAASLKYVVNDLNK